MQDLTSSELLLSAHLADRRREVAALRRTAAAREPRLGLRASLANALAHLALHIDGRAAGSVAARHVHLAGRG